MDVQVILPIGYPRVPVKANAQHTPSHNPTGPHNHQYELTLQANVVDATGIPSSGISALRVAVIQHAAQLGEEGRVAIHELAMVVENLLSNKGRHLLTLTP